MVLPPHNSPLLIAVVSGIGSGADPPLRLASPDESRTKFFIPRGFGCRITQNLRCAVQNADTPPRTLWPLRIVKSYPAYPFKRGRAGVSVRRKAKRPRTREGPWNDDRQRLHVFALRRPGGGYGVSRPRAWLDRFLVQAIAGHSSLFHHDHDGVPLAVRLHLHVHDARCRAGPSLGA